MLSDLRHAIRFLLRAKAWTAVVVVSLALGIGANTALFSAVNGLLLREISVPDPDTLVRARYAGRNEMSRNSSDYGVSAPIGGESVRATFSYSMFQQLRADNRTLEDLIAGAPAGRMHIVIDGAADTASAFLATGNYFRVLGVNAVIGRTFGPEDDQASAPPVGVISHRFWRTRFAGSPDVVGHVFRGCRLPLPSA